jgi:hypothetical protein
MYHVQITIHYGECLPCVKSKWYLANVNVHTTVTQRSNGLLGSRDLLQPGTLAPDRVRYFPFFGAGGLGGVLLFLFVEPCC